MDDGQEHDHYEERLKEVFNSFDTSGCGSLCPEELADLCLSLHLDDATPALLDTLLQNQDSLTARVDFDQFKNALILVLSSNILTPKAEQESPPEPDSPEIQPKFVKGSKRYGRRSTPEFTDPISDLSEDTHAQPAEGEELEDGYDSAVPRKRERWNGHESSTEEYEAEGQMHLWNPDEPSTPCVAVTPLPNRLEERLHHACDELAISWNGCAGHTELLALCDYVDLELPTDMLRSLNGDGVADVQEFVSMVVTHNKPPTPSASTPYRQLKRLHSTQPFDEGGRRIATPSALRSSIGMRLFSTLDDGSGLTPAEHVMDAWIEEGIENSAEILQALNFSLDGKLSLNDLTMALENELLVTKNGIHQAALASFKAEIRYLLECVDRELREKEKIRSDLEKAEKLKTQLATEVDEHHSSIEHKNNLNLRKLEQDHKEKLAAVRAELIKEMDQLQQQAALQREELEADMEKVREDESFLRDHLSISLKENRRLEMELLDSTEKLIETQNHVTKLQRSLDNIMKEKFGDLDPGSADFFLQEERIKQMRCTYEAQCRELQDRIDELQSELQEFHSLSRPHQPCHKPLSEELESKSPGMESDPGIGSEEVHPLSLSLEAEMMLEQLKEQHLQEMEDLRNQLESKISEFAKMVEKQRATQEEQTSASALLHQQEVRALREQIANVESHAQELQSQLEQAELEQTCLVLKPVGEREELEHLQEEEVAGLREQLLEARTLSADLEEQLKTLAAQEAVNEQMTEELRKQHAMQLEDVDKKHRELCDTRVEEVRKALSEEKDASERRLFEEFERERGELKRSHEDELKARLEEAGRRFEEERSEVVQELTQQWQREKARLDEQNNESLQVLLEEEMLRLVKEQEDKEQQLRKEWESEKAQLLLRHKEDLHARVLQERVQTQEQWEQRERKLKKEWEEERLQLEEDYEGMLQERLADEKEKLESEQEEFKSRLERLMAEEKGLLEERHREAVQEMTGRHTEERNTLSSMLDQLRDDVAQERGQIEISFSRRIKEVEDCFSDEQESVAARFQADVLKLERHYQSDLKVLSESHEEQKLKWEAQMREAFEKAEEQRKIAEETFNLEREEWKQERLELEKVHSDEVEVLVTKNQQFERELNNFAVTAQEREIELSQQLNDLHKRLQGSLHTKEELLAQLDRKAAETELWLHHTVEDFGQERAELLSSQSELEAKYAELLSISERQTKERIELLTERDDLKMKVEELERLLTQAAEDFVKERDELQEYVVVLQEQVKEEDRRAGNRMTENETDLSQALDVKSSLTNTEECGSLCDGRQKVSLAADGGSTQSSNEGDNETKIETDATDEEVVEVQITNDNSQCGATAGGDAAEDLTPEVGRCSSQTKLCRDEDPDMTPCVDHNPEPPETACGASVDVEDKKEAVSSDKQGKVEEVGPCLEAFGEGANRRPTDGEKTMSLESCEDENKPQNVPALEPGCALNVDELCHETAVDLSKLEETGDPSELAPENVLDHHLPEVFHTRPHQRGCRSWERSTAERRAEDTCAHDEHQDSSFFQLQGLYSTATEENVLLREKVVLLQQKSELLENLLAHSNEKLRCGYELLEENYSLKVKTLLLMERTKVLELKALMMAELQIRYEDCLCENAKLKDQNGELEKRVWSLESRMNTFPEDERVPLVDEVRGMSQLFRELGTQTPPEQALLDLSVQAVSSFEQHNTRLRRALSALRDNSQTLNESTQAHRSASVRLAEENMVLRQKIAALKEEDLKEAQEELMQTMEHLNNERLAAQKTAESFDQQISELRLHNHQLKDENGTLSEKDARNVADMERLQQQLAEMITEKDRREAFPAQERDKLAACVSALEAELNGALEEAARLEERNSQLSQQLSELTEKAKTAEETLQAFNHESVCLTSDLRVVQQERDSLKHEVSVLHKQVQNANDKNHVLEKAFQSTGLHNQSKKLCREELTRLKDQDGFSQTREKVRQLDSTNSPLRQHKPVSQSTLVRALEQENASLKQELAAQKELAKGRESVQGHVGMENLQQENEALKAQVARMSTHLFESFHAHLVGLLPPSPHRMPRGQHHAEDGDNVQDEREMNMKHMEERMKEIELSLRNVKLLLKEKVAQLKDQLHRNGKADVLIKDLYVENGQLLKALEVTEQRHKIAEKKNYLLEEKISSLNKIVRDLNPSPLSSLSYQFQNS